MIISYDSDRRIFKPSLVFLCGFMAAGKTTVGRILARQIGFNFIDIDEMIESSCSKTIPEIVKQFGFSFIRRSERMMIKDLSTRKDFVISCGGGLYPTAELEPVFSKGLSVFLNADEDIMTERILKNLPAYPKLAKCSSNEDARKEISRLLGNRRKFYEKCLLQVHFRDIPPEVIAGHIMRMMDFQLKRISEQQKH